MGTVSVRECKTAQDVRELAHKLKGRPSTPIVNLPESVRIISATERRRADALVAEANRLRVQEALAWQALHDAFRLSDADEKTLSDLANSQESSGVVSVPLVKILGAVIKYYGVTKTDLLSARRTAVVMRPRQMFFYLARKHTTLSFPAIGRFCGGRDHTTILHGEQKMARLIHECVDVFREMTEIENIIFGRGEQP